MSPHLSSRQIIIAGFAGVAVFMLAMLGIGLSRLDEVNRGMDELANRTFLRTEAVYTMRMVARDRLVSLQSMFFIADPFERDAERLRYGAMALRFIQARETLLGLDPTPAQRAAWEEARRLIARDEELHEQALDAMFGDRPELAAQIIQQEILPLEARLLAVLDRMLHIERSETQSRLADAQRRYRHTFGLLLGMTLATLAVMLGTALYVVRRLSHNERLILQAKQRAEQTARKLSWAASHDALTGLPNRGSFELRLAELLTSTQQEGGQHVLAYLDLDRFKQINDRHGHEAGDQMLVAVARAMRAELGEAGWLARLGGDEFGLLLPRCDLARAERLVAELTHRVEACVLPWGRHELRVGVSVGIVPLDPAATPAELVRRADLACYAAKGRRAGPGRPEAS